MSRITKPLIFLSVLLFLEVGLPVRAGGQVNDFTATNEWLVWLGEGGFIQGLGLPVQQGRWLQRDQKELLLKRTPPLFKALSAGEDRLLALRPDGSVYGFGDNTFGNLGQSIHEHRSGPIHHELWRSYYNRGIRYTPWVQQPRLIFGVLGARQVSAGRWQTMAVLEDGSLCTWGLQDINAPGKKMRRVEIPGKTRSFSPGKLRSDGMEWRKKLKVRLVSLSDQQLIPWKVAGLPPVRYGVVGEGYFLALDRQGEVWSWGFNNNGQLGDGTKENGKHPKKINGLTDVVSLAAGATHSLALDKHGVVWSWGNNYFGQLGRFSGWHLFARKPAPITEIPVASSIATSNDLSAVLDRQGGVWWWGGGHKNHPPEEVWWKPHRLQLPDEVMGHVDQIAILPDGIAVHDRKSNRIMLFLEPLFEQRGYFVD
mgnify:CR=1 FL=1